MTAISEQNVQLDNEVRSQHQIRKQRSAPTYYRKIGVPALAEVQEEVRTPLNRRVLPA